MCFLSSLNKLSLFLYAKEVDTQNHLPRFGHNPIGKYIRKGISSVP